MSGCLQPLGGGSGSTAGGLGGAPLVAADHFRLEHIQDEFNFVTDEELETSKRFRLIQLRDEGVEGFKHVHVPAFDREVPDALFSVSYHWNRLIIIISHYYHLGLAIKYF